MIHSLLWWNKKQHNLLILNELCFLIHSLRGHRWLHHSCWHPNKNTGSDIEPEAIITHIHCMKLAAIPLVNWSFLVFLIIPSRLKDHTFLHSVCFITYFKLCSVVVNNELRFTWRNNSRVHHCKWYCIKYVIDCIITGVSGFHNIKFNHIVILEYSANSTTRHFSQWRRYSSIG